MQVLGRLLEPVQTLGRALQTHVLTSHRQLNGQLKFGMFRDERALNMRVVDARLAAYLSRP